MGFFISQLPSVEKHENRKDIISMTTFCHLKLCIKRNGHRYYDF